MGKADGSDNLMEKERVSERGIPEAFCPSTVTVIPVSPVVSGVPLISPVTTFRDSPGGRPTAEYTIGSEPR